MKLDEDINTNYSVGSPNEEWKRKYGTITINHNHGKDIKTLKDLEQALEVANRDDVFAKLKAEIEQKQYDFMSDSDYDEGVRFGLMLAYQIVGRKGGD